MRYRALFVSALIILSLLINSTYCLAEGKASEHAAGSYPEPLGKAAVLMDAASGRVLYSRNGHQRMSPASVTKIMTALLVVENGHLNESVTISQKAADTPEASIWLEAGEKLTREQLLYGCMLNSANDAAMALAESVAGSEEAFVEQMNQRARQLGLKDTHYCNPHGLETSGHYSSAYDLALLARKALTYQVFRRVVSTKTKTIPWPGKEYDRLLINQNRLLYRYDGAIGVKTGYTKQAGNCVVGAVERNGMILIAVSLNSPQVYQDLEQMLDYGFAHYSLVTLKKKTEVSIPVEVEKGQSSSVAAGLVSDLSLAVDASEKDKVSFKMFPEDQVVAPVAKGQKLGESRVYLEGKEIMALDLVATASVGRRLPFFARHPVLTRVLEFLVVVFGILYLIRFYNLRRRSKKLRAGRRR